jgi:hypothetical protein
MAKLSARGRKAIPTKNFALSGRRYPIHDRAHGANALSRCKAHCSPSEYKTVRGKVCARYPTLPSCKK